MTATTVQRPASATPNTIRVGANVHVPWGDGDYDESRHGTVTAITRDGDGTDELHVQCADFAGWYAADQVRKV